MSLTASSEKIARTTSDRHWTLTQTISKSAGPPSIKVVTALKNNRAVAATAYLVRYADVAPGGSAAKHLGITGNMAFGFYDSRTTFGSRFGLLLENAGNQTFGYWQSLYQGEGYAGPVPAFGTKTATMMYRDT